MGLRGVAPDLVLLGLATQLVIAIETGPIEVTGRHCPNNRAPRFVMVPAIPEPAARSKRIDVGKCGVDVFRCQPQAELAHARSVNETCA